MTALNEFNIDGRDDEFSVFPPVSTTKYPEEMQDYLAAIHSATRDIPIDAAKQEIASIGDDYLALASRQEATLLVNDRFNRNTKSAIEVTSLPAIIEAETGRVSEQEVVDNTKSPEVLAETLGNLGDVWDSVSTRAATRQATLHKMLAERADATSLTFLSGVMDFADILVSYPLDILTGGGFHRADLAKEISTLVTADIPEQEFNDRLTAILDEAADAGWFTDENALILYGQIQSIQEGSGGLSARLDKAGTVFDATGLPSLGSAAFRAARNTTSLVGVLRGAKAAKANLAQALVKPSTSQATAAGIPQHTMPGFVRHPDSGVDPYGWSAPGFEAAAKHERENTFLNIVRDAKLSARIDPDVLDAARPQILENLNNELNATSRSNVLNMSVLPDEAGNLFGTITFGRRDGTAFLRKSDATKFAKNNGLDPKTSVIPSEGPPTLVRASNEASRPTTLSNRPLANVSEAKIEELVTLLDKLDKLEEFERLNPGKGAAGFSNRKAEIEAKIFFARSEIEAAKVKGGGDNTLGRSVSEPDEGTSNSDLFGEDVNLVSHVQGGEITYTVQQVKNIPTSGLADPLTAQEIGNHFFNEWGATFLSIPQRLETLAKRGEGVFGAINAKITPIFKAALKATSKEEHVTVEKVFSALRDGDNLSHTRRALTNVEFRNEWAKHTLPVGGAPSQAAEDLYNTTQELNDALYFLKADKIYKEVVDEGLQVLPYKSVGKDGKEFARNLLVKAAPDDLPRNTIVYDLATGERLPAGKIKGKRSIFVVSGGLEVGEETARIVSITSPVLRRVHHSDVLGYNPGGPRGYEFVNFAVKQETTHSFVDGGTAAGRPRTFMGTATRKEAEATVGQVNTIFAKLKDMVPNLEGLSKANALDALRGIGNDPDLLDVVLKNNDWNPNIGSVDDFIKFIDDYKLDVRKNVGSAAMDDVFGVGDEAGNITFGATKGETNRDAFDSILNSPRNGPRQNDPLIGYGGDGAQTISPIDMISRDYLRTVHQHTFDAYNFQAVNGWLKGAKGRVINDVSGLRPREAMNAAKFAKVPNDLDRSLMAARDAINRTLGQVSEHEIKWNGMVDRLAASIYDKGFQKSGMTIAKAQLSKRPLEALRGFAFHARLGLFAIDQLFVQSSQIFNILAIAGPRRAGPATIASVGPVQMALIHGGEDFIRELGRRAGPFIGMDADEFPKFIRWVKESGRLVVEGTVSELNTVNTVMAKGYAGKVLGAGRAFFDAGERVPRIAAIHVAWKEYAAKWPTLDPFSNHGINWITSRQDVLTASMTRASAATWQKGPLSVPLQFLSYSSRMMESIFSDRLLTGGLFKTVKGVPVPFPHGERGRLFTAQLAFWGAAGTGIGGPMLDAYINEGGLQLTDGWYTLFRYGVLDAIIGAATGSDTGIGSRLAVGEGFWNLYEDFTEKTLFEAAGGPSAQAVVDVTDVILQSLGDLARGDTNMVEADVTKLFRNFTGANKAYNAWLIYTTGDYTSRNAATIAGGLTKSDAILLYLGAPLQEVSSTYSRIDVMRDQDEYLKQHGKRMAEMAREMRSKLKAGDMEGAKEIGKQLAAANGILEPWQQNKVRKYWEPETRTLYESVLQQGLERHQGALDRYKGE